MEVNQNNIFFNFQQKKQKVCQLAESALKAGWLNETEYKEIISKIDKDILTIGVIGQMKCGKSTFLNSFLFSRQLLPAATTPMTAALSVITYGDKEGILVEFYSEKEWEELKLLCSRDENEIDDLQMKSSIKAAKELYSKSVSIGNDIPRLLSSTVEDSLDNLIEYVGANGKFVSIVKSVRITLSEEWLKGVEIVDTPGFNDPVISREERTKDFLKRADVVLLMLYAGRAFDATDRDILFDKVRKVGIGKIILAVNKYDIQLSQGESPEAIKGFVVDELRKAIRQNRDESISELLEDIDPILVSAQMALLAKMPLSEINQNADLKFHFNKACDDFGFTTQSQLLELSQISKLEDKVRDLISNQKEEILIRKPINQIFQSANNELDSIKSRLVQLNEEKKYLEIPDVELDVKIANLEKAKHRIERKIQNAEYDFSEAYDETNNKVFRDLQNLADEAKDNCIHIIDTYKKNTLIRKLTARLEYFRDRELPRSLEDASKTIKKSLKDNILQLTEDVEAIVDKYLDDSEEIAEDFRRILIKGLDFNVSTNKEDSTETEGTEEDYSFADVIKLFGKIIISIPVAPYIGISSLFDSRRQEAREMTNDFFGSIDWQNIQYQLQVGKEGFLGALNGDAALTLINNLVGLAQKARDNREEKEKRHAVVVEDIKILENRMNQINDEIMRFKALITNN